jgi:hypothetical protein
LINGPCVSRQERVKELVDPLAVNLLGGPDNAFAAKPDSFGKTL